MKAPDRTEDNAFAGTAIPIGNDAPERQRFASQPFWSPEDLFPFVLEEMQ